MYRGGVWQRWWVRCGGGQSWHHQVGWSGGQVPGHVVGRAGRVASCGDAGLHAVRALQAQRVIGVLTVLSTLPPSWQVVQDGVVHEGREARGACREGARPTQGVPLALSLSCCFLLQLSQSPPLLLNHLLPYRRDRWESQWATHPSGRTLAPSQTEGRGEQGEFNTGHPHEPPPASLKPPQLQVQLPCQCFSRLHIWPQPRSLASALFLHPEPIQGTDPAHVVPWQHDGQVAPAHNQGLNGGDICTHPACWGREKEEMVGAP